MDKINLLNYLQNDLMIHLKNWKQSIQKIKTTLNSTSDKSIFTINVSVCLTLNKHILKKIIQDSPKI
jgi:hypothetical protein